MTIENIIKKIEEETQAEVNKILQEANSNVTSLQQEANKTLSDKLNHIKNEGDKRITIMRNIHLSEARRVSRRTTLRAKEDLIDECFRQAREKLKELTGEEYKTVIVRLINDSLPLINNKGSVTLTREEDRSILTQFPNLTINSKVIPGLGGLLLESADGKIVVDNTFEAILERQKEDIRTEVANILFPDNQ
jgi:V/A-type H+-transporting ATPase subunit E